MSSTPKSKSPSKRNRLARIFEQDLGNIVGYVLTLRRVLQEGGTARGPVRVGYLVRRRSFSWSRAIAIRLPPALESHPLDHAEDVEYSSIRPVQTGPDSRKDRERKPILLPSRHQQKRLIRPRSSESQKGRIAAWVSRPALHPGHARAAYVVMPPIGFIAITST